MKEREVGMDLHGPQGYWSCNWRAWRFLLNAAQEFGWQPRGTLPPHDCEGEWKGGYYSNDWQEVTPEDARELGEALQKAIASVRSGNTEVLQFDPITDEECFVSELLRKAGLKPAYVDEIDLMTDFATFVLMDGFVIG
jgi:hypothetical protein